MFDLEALLADLGKNNAPPTRKPANHQENTSSTTKDVAGSEPATYPQAPATHPQAPAPSAPVADSLRVMRVDAGKQPASENAVQDEINPDLAGLRVDERFVQPEPDPREPLIARLLAAGRNLGWSNRSLEGWQSWAATQKLEVLEARALTTEARAGVKNTPQPPRQVRELEVIARAWEALEHFPPEARAPFARLLNRADVRLAVAHQILFDHPPGGQGGKVHEQRKI